MKKSFLIFCLFSAVTNGFAQKNLSTKDSISTFYNSLVSTMKSEYLYKDDVAWSQTEIDLKERLLHYKDFKSSLKEITFLFDTLKATHCSVHYGENAYSSSYDGPSNSDFSDQWIKKFKTNPSFEVKVLDNQFGYILMPAINSLNSKKVHKIAQPMYDEISKIKNSKNIKGWIVDLRFNTGGSCIPMILGLYDFLGDNDVWGTLDVNMELIETTKLKGGKYMSNGKKTSYIKPKGELLDKAKVAVITGIATASSGEVTALAFKGRANTVFIGENTYGATTANKIVILPFVDYMALTEGYDCDRNGMYYEKIVPDIKIEKQDNFDNLLLDKNIIAAINYINEK